MHPLISPCMVRDWSGSPPLYIVSGQERIADSAKLIAQKAVRQGVKVAWEEYEAMPHIFVALFSQLPHSEMCMERWAKACKVLGGGEGVFKSKGVWIEVESMEAKEVDVTHLTDLSDEEVKRLLREGVERRRELEKSLFGKQKAML